MKKLLAWIIFCFILSGCSTVKYVAIKSPVVIPAPPKAVSVDDGKIDKKKFPNTTWVHKPEILKGQQKAAWSFDDIDKISRGLTEWSEWGKSVDEIVGEHNSSVSEPENKKPWYKFW